MNFLFSNNLSISASIWSLVCFAFLKSIVNCLYFFCSYWFEDLLDFFDKMSIFLYNSYILVFVSSLISINSFYLIKSNLIFSSSILFKYSSSFWVLPSIIIFFRFISESIVVFKISLNFWTSELLIFSKHFLSYLANSS